MSERDEFLPQHVLEQWRVPQMPEDMEERVMLQLQEHRVMDVPAVALAVQSRRAGAIVIALVTTAAAIAASVAGIAIAIRRPDDADSLPPAARAAAPAVVASEPLAPLIQQPITDSMAPAKPLGAATNGAPPRPRGSREPMPRVLIMQADVEGALDRLTIRRIARAHVDEVRYCYNQGLARDPTLAGRVAVQFTIVPTGKVAVAVVVLSTLTDRAVGQCIAKAVKRWVFPKPRTDSYVVVTYPFVLEPS